VNPFKGYNYRLFAPTLNPNTGRYATFLQQCIAPNHDYGDCKQPTVQAKNLGNVPIVQVIYRYNSFLKYRKKNYIKISVCYSRC